MLSRVQNYSSDSRQAALWEELGTGAPTLMAFAQLSGSALAANRQEPCEELSDEEIFAIRPRWLRDELEKSKLPPDDKLQVIQRVQRLKDELERRDPYYGLGRF